MVRVQQARSWVPVPATLISSGITSSSASGKGGRRISTRRLEGTYSYVWNDVEYMGQRMEFSYGADNFGSARRAAQWRRLRAESLRVYVDPAHPTESVFDPTLPAERMTFYAIFLLFPCFLGIAWIWNVPMMSGAHRDDHPWYRIGGWGMTMTFLWIPLFIIALFPGSLGLTQWMLLGMVVAVVVGSRVWLRKLAPT